MTQQLHDQPIIKVVAPLLFRILFGLCLGVLISEFILLIMGIPKFHQVHSSPSQFFFVSLEDGGLFYVNKPSTNIGFVYDSNERGYFDERNTVQHNTNDMGFRGSKFSQEKNENTVRIAFLGDSFTFGEGVRDKDVFTFKTAQNLNENSEGKSYESYNFGVGGYNAQQSIFLFKNVVLDLNPDVVLFVYTLNDAEPMLFQVDEKTNQTARRARELAIHEGLPDIKPPNKLIYKLRLGKLWWKVKTSKEISQKTIKYYQSLYEEDNQDWIAAQKSLEEYEGVCRENEIRCYFVMFPLLINLDENYPFYDIHEMVTSKVEQNNIPVIDILPSLLGMEHAKLWVHPTDQHPNEIVHDIVANLVSDRLLEDGL
jgi:hypothetical protein